jgi:hypothetical protein
MNKKIILGVLIGFLANFIGMILYVVIFLDSGFDEAIYKITHFNLLGKIIALGAALNFLPFFICLNKNKVYMARGVLIATIIAALITLIYKLNNWLG